MQNILPWQNCSQECEFKNKKYFWCIFQIIPWHKTMTKHFRVHDKHLHNNVSKIWFLKTFYLLDSWDLSFVYRDIKDAISNPWSPCDNIWSRIEKLKLKTRRPNFANVSNEKTRVPLEAMSLKLRDLKRCGQVIWLLWGIPIGFLS